MKALPPYTNKDGITKTEYVLEGGEVGTFVKNLFHLAAGEGNNRFDVNKVDVIINGQTTPITVKLSPGQAKNLIGKDITGLPFKSRTYYLKSDPKKLKPYVALDVIQSKADAKAVLQGEVVAPIPKSAFKFPTKNALNVAPPEITQRKDVTLLMDRCKNYPEAFNSTFRVAKGTRPQAWLDWINTPDAELNTPLDEGQAMAVYYDLEQVIPQ